ncbi:hypothetical protein C2E23DRAFT_581543 [Lenzites betulinus]|nr:hypothetical protein C2E23DRAFT_581543 [Lenzites betulinus]
MPILVFVTGTVNNSSIIDSATGQPVYNVSTPSGLGNNTTSVFNTQGNVVGQFKPGFLHDTVTRRGQTTRVSEWLVKKKIFARARQFVASNGKEYKWVFEWDIRGDKGVKLFECAMGRQVAHAHRKAFTQWSFSSSKAMSIDVSPDVLEILDDIVLSFIICESMTEQEETSAIVSSTT